MKITIKGEMTLADIARTLREVMYSLEEDHRLRYTRGATLYINPTNGFGDEIKVWTKDGHELVTLNSTGPYRSAAEDFNL
jgi:hypothetical protein